MPSLNGININTKKHYFDSKTPIEPEEYEYYECLTCGIREDQEEDDGEAGGIVFPSGSGEPTAGETYICSSCRKRIYSPSSVNEL